MKKGNGNKKDGGRSKSQGKANGGKFYGCGKLGHFISECYKEKNKFRD